MSKAGKTSNLSLTHDEISGPAEHEVQISIKAIGLNFADIFAMHGLYSATPKGSFIPGLEFSGIVESVGSGVENCKTGDRVMCVTKFGAYCDRINMDARYVMPLSDDWSYEEGASYLVQGLTAYYALVSLGNLTNDSTVLIHSGAGGVGIMANRIAKNFNCYTIGTIGSDSKIDVMKDEGYDQYIIRDKQFGRKLDEALQGRDLNLILETIGGKIFKEGYKRLAAQGRMIVVGASQYASPGSVPNYLKMLWYFINRPKIDPQMMIQENRGVLAFNLIWLYEKVDLMNELLKEMNELDLGKPYVGKVYNFNDMDKAIKFFQSGRSTGKVVVSL